MRYDRKIPKKCTQLDFASHELSLNIDICDFASGTSMNPWDLNESNSITNTWTIMI